MWIGLFGAFLFIIIQLILLIDFAHGWAESWVEKYEETESKCYYFGKISLKNKKKSIEKWFVALAGVLATFFKRKLYKYK